MKFPMLLVAALLCLGVGPAVAQAPTPQYGYRVVHRYPHSTQSFTEGLFYKDGYLYESTGLEGRSAIQKEELETGRIVQKREIAPQYFGEGIVAWKNRLIELTWRSQVGFIYDLATFKPTGSFGYSGEGWALTHDGKRLIMSDGTPQLRFLDPVTLKETGRVLVTDGGRPVGNLNELEYVRGEIYANIWLTDRIARIDPVTGAVLGWIDLSGILSPADRIPGQTDVLNGIAYDAKGGRLFVTGKMWPAVFEIELVEKR
ncbi:MAG TPA: glutaminyl-peptide cyclotransferase [Caulobacteraceae bacterium]|jgi:glutamine cyclotransferase|nr:glutaminyl-peptide cyclotransferase [Caulobacteraceae bacterium]